MATTSLADAIDIERYPIQDLEGPAGRALVERCRSELAELGACGLPGFVRRDAAERIVDEVDDIRAQAFRTETTHNIEFSGREAELDPDDPLAIQVRSAKSLIAYDQIPPSCPLVPVYESDELTRFVGAALEMDPIYRQADDLGALNVMVYDPGDELGWHFDNSDFAVTLMLQAPSGGGGFEYVPMLRTPEDANATGVARLLHGDRAGVRSMDQEVGTLTLFRGRLSPHRVTPVEGSTPRINAVLSYARDPDARLTPSARRIFFGR